MGLDVYFVVPGEEEIILGLRNHHDFFCLIGARRPPLAYFGSDDLLIDSYVLEEVAAQLQEEMREAGLSEDDIPAEVPEAFWYRDGREIEWTEVLPVYARITLDLIDAVETHGTLICAFSA
ncbi:hypothetical protein T8T21_16120 (plasmid) [Limimaricola variabilis]|uniref:hypothetical protein n=1 Tax=Limimaricola variabilis TaxID=1492771 RepID=UPI002AC9B2BD|nr:hypothetical protein [Limimaricola variabilis]WPY96299.1 hypothetical protein T8T21_16120 [Limimaricola variabilis]